MGLPDLKTILDRCNEVGECWLWAQGVNTAGYPSASHEGKPVLVRRRAFELARGYAPDGRKRGLVMTCRNFMCVNPAHMRDAPRSVLVKAALKQRQRPVDYLNQVRGRMKQGTKLDFDKARLIRADPRVAAVIAADWGCSTSLIVQVKRNEIWREAAPNCSVFHMQA